LAQSHDVLDEVLSVTEAARALELPEAEVRALLADGTLEGRKIGRSWFTTVAACEALAEELDAEDGDDEFEDEDEELDDE
jgi:hypothetical protein